ncbi:hypothetical protein [Bacillus aquiflavi]|nr:hypothetical protein [Bacillus aquiflavi]
MIKRQANIKNRRELLITLGERGRKYAELLYVIDEQLVKKYYSKVELKDLQHVLTTLTKLVESVKNEN